MVKRRIKSFINNDKNNEKAIEDFASQADKILDKKDDDYSHDPQAKRNFKSINVPLNAYEHEVLEKVSQSLGRTKLNTMRWALLKLFDEIKKD
jgi:hypothetical protein